MPLTTKEIYNNRYSNGIKSEFLWYSEQEVQELKDKIREKGIQINELTQKIKHLEQTESGEQFSQECIIKDLNIKIEKLQKENQELKDKLNEREIDIRILNLQLSKTNNNFMNAVLVSKQIEKLQKENEELKSKLEHNSDKELLKVLEQEEKRRKK